MPDVERHTSVRNGRDRRGEPRAESVSDSGLAWLQALETSLADGGFTRLTLGHYTGREDGLKGIQARRVLIQGAPRLSFTYRYPTRDIVKNADTAESIRWITRALADGFQTGTLCTSGFDLVYERQANGRETLRRTAATHPIAEPVAHDHLKKRLIAAAGKPYLQALGITGPDGAVLKRAQDKYRQINRYVELLAPMITAEMQTVVDMGAGKGYLTFALYDFMTTVRHMAPQITGVEQRTELVSLCNGIARASGFHGLRFVQGSLLGFDTAGVNMLIALHACDTATDDALAGGIAAGADLIVVAPCCHKQIRREMEQPGNGNAQDFLLKHGIFVERQAEMVTDGLRALILEAYGYTTRVFEFISDAHTPRNVMITGQRNPRPPSPAEATALRESIHAAKARFGIGTHYLETALKRRLPSTPDALRNARAS